MDRIQRADWREYYRSVVASRPARCYREQLDEAQIDGIPCSRDLAVAGNVFPFRERP
jgi:hypothetical protein